MAIVSGGGDKAFSAYDVITWSRVTWLGGWNRLTLNDKGILRAKEFYDKNIYVLQLGQACVTSWGGFVLLQIRANIVTNWGSFITTNWGKYYYKLGELLQIRPTVITK